MGKGFNRAKNKQAELARKLEVARKGKENGTQKENQPNEKTDDGNGLDRELFEKLLTTTKGAVPGIGRERRKKDKKPKPPLKTKVEKDEWNEKISQRSFFEDLIDLKTSQTLGPINAARLVPWVPPYLKDCLVVFTDPRHNSGGLRQTLKYMKSELEGRDSNEKYNQQVVFVCTDNVQEMKSWLRRSNIEPTFPIFSDPEMKFLSAYGLIGSKDIQYQWSMSMLVFDTDGKKPKIFRDIDPYHAPQMALNVMNEYESES